ncbi:MAG: substrate-binding domain-containing protein [Vicinamibacteria bacterium]
MAPARPRVVVSLLTSAQEFQVLQAADAKAAGARLGIEVETVFADNNAIQQIHQLFAFVHAPAERRPSAIVVEPVKSEGMERLARNAVKAGIGWILQQGGAAYLEKLRAENPAVPVASLSVDDAEIGRIQARQLQALLPRGGRVLMVQGPLDSPPAIARFQGLQQGLGPSAITLESVLHGDWTSDSAQRAVGSWLRLRSTDAVEVDLVASQNDSMAAGARQAIGELRRGWQGIPFIGCDGLPEGGRRLVDTMQLAATIVKPTTAGRGVELVSQALAGRSIPLEVVLQAQSYPPLEQLTRRRPL